MTDHHSFSATTTSPGPATANPIRLIFSRNSLRNATYDCDSASIHYRISTPLEGIKTTRVTSVYRWDKRTNEEILVAEWERNFRTDRMRLLTRVDMPKDFQSVKDIIETTWHFPFDTTRSFIGEDGRKYTWKIRSFCLKLYPADGDDASNPIAEFHRPNYVFDKRKAYLQLQPEALEILDTLIVTFLYTEKKRRDAEKASSGGGGD